ncbi:tryptophan synthase subunit alpha [Virgibacillus oceani]
MGIEKINHTFQKKLADNEKLFVPYIMAGDGGLNILEERIAFLEECNVSAIELGIPFSDPVADGPTIQQAGLRALQQGTTLSAVLNTLKDTAKKRRVPIILMTYMNPVLQYGPEEFAADCEGAGVDGVIIPDLPLEEEKIISAPFKAHSLALIRLAARTSSDDRLKKLAAKSNSFLYAVSVTGTTGIRSTHDSEVEAYLKKLKSLSTFPVLAGFGVSNSKQARELSSYCDGVIVGSKIVDLFHEGKTGEIRKLVSESLNIQIKEAANKY